MALNSAAGIYYSLKGLVNSCELTLKGLDDVAAKYAAKQEAWYKEHAGAVQDGCSIAMGSYTDRQTGQVIEVGACFVAGTKIQTPGGEVNIEDIQAGDLVYACNVDTGEVGVKEVKQTFVREVNTLVHVFVGDEEIITTTNHPFYVVGRGFVKAEDLRIGYTLLQLDGSTEKISRIVVENLGAPVKVYNFEVEDWHTYYVTNAGMLVHNANYKPLEGGSNYSNLKDSKSVGSGKRFTLAQKKKIIQQNMERNGGVIKSDMSGEILVPAKKSQKGVTPNPLEVQIDHIEPRSKGGTNSYSNAQVLSRYENIKKSDK